MKSASALPVRSKWAVLTAVMLGSIMGPIDGSIVNTVLPAISDYFAIDMALVQWVPTIYLLAISALILLYGRLGDMIGYKRVFLTGLASFVLTSILCGVSQNIWMLITFRAFQGVAAAMTMSVSFAIVTSSFPPSERGKAMGIYAIAIAAGLALGPTLGGVITEYLNWRYIFFINIPIGISALILGSRVIPRGERDPEQTLDWQGALTALVFLGSLTMYANRGEDWGWLSGTCIVLLCITLISGIVFFSIERSSKQPMLNLSLFKNRTFSFANMSALFNFIALYTMIFITPFFLKAVLGYSILKLGIVMVASPAAILIVAPFSGSLSDRIGSRPLTVTGMLVSALGLYLLSTLDQSSGVFDVVWRLIIMGVGMGVFQSPNNSAVMGSVPPWRLGISSGVLAAMRNVGMVLGLAVAGAVLYHIAPVAAEKPPEMFSPAEVDQFLNGLQWTYVTGAGLALVSALASFIAGNVKRKDVAGAKAPPS
ncbi:MAG: MFS transporter [Dehalococcoidia bacterium]